MSIRLAIICLFLTTATASARDWIVQPDGLGDAPTIQAAIDSLESGVDTIVLTDGVFTGDGNRDISNWGKMFVLRSQSGDPTVCIIDCEGSPDDQHYGLAFLEDG